MLERWNHLDFIKRLRVIEHCMWECFQFHTLYTVLLLAGEGNIFFTIMTGVLVLKGNHAKVG